jgi:hypothetical protein
MRELTIVELDLVVGGLYIDQPVENGSFEYGNSYVSDLGDGSGDWAGAVYQADASVFQAEAQARNIDWGVEGTYGSGGWSVKAHVGGKC